MLRDLVEHATSDTRWIAIIDDDTFFPSFHQLSKALDEFDSSQPLYIGGLSEDLLSVEAYGLPAYGGAGVFLSVPLAQKLEPEIEYCLETFNDNQGDGLLFTCVTNLTQTPLSVIPALHQVDLMGDISGFYESGHLPLSTHHWKSWNFIPMAKMAKIADFCGGCFLQRWRFGTDTILSNGYSIAVYEHGTKHLDLNKIEGTWDDLEKFESSLGPIRDPVAKESKRSYYLLDTEKIGQRFRQIYVHRADGSQNHGSWSPWRWSDGSGKETRDEVVELWWELR
jgi:hypothetical protein